MATFSESPKERPKIDDATLESVSKVMHDGATIPGVVQELVDSEFTFDEIQDIFSRLGYYVARNGSQYKGEMLISNEPGPLAKNAKATTVRWGHDTPSKDDIIPRNHPEEVLIKKLKEQGVPIKDIVAKLVGDIGLTASELRELFTRLGYKIYGGGYGEPQGWMIIVNPAGDLNDVTQCAPVYWGDHEEDRDGLVVTWE